MCDICYYELHISAESTSTAKYMKLPLSTFRVNHSGAEPETFCEIFNTMGVDDFVQRVIHQ